MKALKVIGGIFAVLALAAGAFWFFMLRHPSPEDVCEHVVAIVAKDSGGAPTAAATAECVRKMQPPLTGGAIAYAKRMKCAMAASSTNELETCR